MKVELKNGNIMVKAIERTKEEEQTASGIYISKETLEEDQVSQGTVIESSDEDYKKDDVVFFHKVMPVDASLKYRNNELEVFWFIKQKDIICKIIN